MCILKKDDHIGIVACSNGQPLCNKNKNGDYNYSDWRKTPDGRAYKLEISSAATSGRRVWVWAYSSYNPNAKSCAVYDMKENQWLVKKRNNFINLVD